MYCCLLFADHCDRFWENRTIGGGGGGNKNLTYVTGSEKRDHFAQDIKIELLVLKGRVALKQ